MNGAVLGLYLLFWAHVGGFAAGVLLKLFARPDHVAAHRAHHWQPRRMRSM